MRYKAPIGVPRREINATRIVYSRETIVWKMEAGVGFLSYLRVVRLILSLCSTTDITPHQIRAACYRGHLGFRRGHNFDDPYFYACVTHMMPVLMGRVI